MKEQIKQVINTTLDIYEIARPWNAEKSKLIKELSETAAKDILKIINKQKTKRKNKRCSAR